MPSDPIPPNDELYERAADIADRHLGTALDEATDFEYLVAVMMIEASVNAAVDLTSRDDIVRLLKDLAQQIEQDADEDED